MTELRKLIETVEAGDSINLDALYAAGILKDWSQGYTLVQAMGGSLDCAHKLHEALLDSGFHAEIWDCTTRPHVKVIRSDEIHDGHEQVTAARSWLIAILKAYEAQQ